MLCLKFFAIAEHLWSSKLMGWIVEKQNQGSAVPTTSGQ